MNLKLGKQPATEDHRDLLFANYRVETIPEAPVGFDHTALVKDPWGMLGNDAVGDCAVAGPMHETMLLNAEAGLQVAFTEADAIATYSAISGYKPGDPSSDVGCNVRDVLSYRASKGIPSAAGWHKIGAYVALKAGDWHELLEALFVFECVGIGVEMPASAMEQFQEEKPWTVVRDSRVVGGHYVPCVSRPSEEMVEVVTWGAKQKMARPFYEQYADEAWAYVSSEDLTLGKTLEGFDVGQLAADLSALR